MKTLRNALTTIACLSAMAGYPTNAQEAPPGIPALPAAPAAGVELLPAPPAAYGGIQLAQASVAPEAIGVAQVGSGGQVNWIPNNDGFRFNLLGGANRPRTLVIRTSETDPKAVSMMEEDMSIMSRILAKAVNEKGTDDDPMTAMGMKIKTLAVSGHSPVQNLYLDGYGALFLLSVRFPLVPPPEPTKEEVRKAPSNSTWEEARRELYGSKEPAAGVGRLFFSEGPRETYDAKKVASLKESLIEALRNASNIRDLKSDEFVTLVVTGGDNATESGATKVVESRGDGTSQIFAYSSGGRRLMSKQPLLHSAAGDTTLTIRAKKSDIDAYAKGDLKLEEFQKKVSSATY